MKGQQIGSCEQRYTRRRAEGRRNQALRLCIYMLLLLATVSLTGCRGCDSADPAAQESEEASEEEKLREKIAEEKKKKPPLEVGPLLPMIGEDLLTIDEAEFAEDTEEKSLPAVLAKPGHWTATVQQMVANYEDYVGQSTNQVLDENGNPVPLQYSRFRFECSRPVVLAKGRPKRIESELYVPETTEAERVRSAFWNRKAGRQEYRADPKLQLMPSYQYYIVVLAAEQSRYGFLKVTDTVRAEWEEELEQNTLSHYRVVLADPQSTVPLPANPLCWTSLAYLFWDEVDPTRLSPEQQAALVDWLHWGGRLIVNGPDSLALLQGSFLDEYLPVDGGGGRKLGAQDLRVWSQYWAARSQGTPQETLVPLEPWSGIELKPRSHGRELAGGGRLFYEGNVGAGSIVVSAVQLAERDLINWPGYDGFLNAGLLRRPPRQFAEGPLGGLRIDWAELNDRRLDAHLITPVRIFARDANQSANWFRVENLRNNQFGMAESYSQLDVDRVGGLGSWDEFTPISEAARNILREVAAVEVPGAGFVLVCLALYLIVLVPLNWMVFYSLNRVEWAWFAAPVIAVVGTVIVVRQAQLDIGFVRSQTDVGLLELEGSHDRGHLTQFTALYSSLSTTYAIEYGQPTTLAKPFPAEKASNLRFGDWLDEVELEKSREAHLRGITISSASTRMVHSEQMVPLEGGIFKGKSSVGQDQVVNRSGLDLEDVTVVRRYFVNGQPRYQGTWIGPLRSGESRVLNLMHLNFSPGKIPYAQEREEVRRRARRERINVDPLLELAFGFAEEEDPLYQEREEYRLIAWTEDLQADVTYSPAASQQRDVTVVLAHLEFGPPAVAARPDVNSRGDVIEPERRTAN